MAARIRWSIPWLWAAVVEAMVVLLFWISAAIYCWSWERLSSVVQGVLVLELPASRGGIADAGAPMQTSLVYWIMFFERRTLRRIAVCFVGLEGHRCIRCAQGASNNLSWPLFCKVLWRVFPTEGNDPDPKQLESKLCFDTFDSIFAIKQLGSCDFSIYVLTFKVLV